jgi:hypothetical protein
MLAGPVLCGAGPRVIEEQSCGGRGGLQHEVVLMDDMEEYTINDDLRACGLLGDDEDDLASSGEALFGSSARQGIVR